MATFALLHGAWHGGWAWEQIVPRLEAAGHAAVAPDLPCADLAAGTPEYAQVALDALGDADDVIVVGHSMGGLTAPLVAAARPVCRLVLLAALVPQPGRSLVDQLRAEPGLMLHPRQEGLEHDDERRSRWRDAEVAAQAMYTYCHPLVAAGAFARLRPQASAPQVRPSPLAAWPDVPTDYVACTGDRMVSPSWGARRARELRATVRELPSDHSPMLSRPVELTRLLLEYAKCRDAKATPRAGDPRHSREGY
jgi:pimeloyl-ACP methyl ester carboxylesterase